MKLFFERLVTRRNFLRDCGWFALSGVVLSRLVKFAEAQEAKLGHIAARKALHYDKLSNERVRCNLCPHRCVVGNGKRGFCRVRENRNGDY